MAEEAIDWKNPAERKDFEEAYEKHRNRHKDKTAFQKFFWFNCTFILNGGIILLMYGAAAHILMNEAWDTKAAEELKMKIITRSVFANDKFVKLMQDVTRQRKMIFEK